MVTAYLVELDSLIGDENDLVPGGPTETQNVGVLRLQRRQALLHLFPQPNQVLLFWKRKWVADMQGHLWDWGAGHTTYLTLLGELCVRVVGNEVDEVLQTRWKSE